MPFCFTCYQTKTTHEFYRGNNRRCKACVRSASAEWRAANKDRVKAVQRAYYLGNAETMSANARGRYRRERALILAQTKERARRYRKEKIALIITRRIGKQIAKVLKGAPSRGWRGRLGYDPALLVPHIESQFEGWMTWENYGTEWHIDHRRPIASFDLPAQIRECWALSNLRPLRAIENLRKGARWEATI